MMSKKTSYNRKPLHDQVRDDFLERIASGIWAADHELTSEVEIAKEIQLSLGTVRKAFDAVVAFGLVERQQGRGSYVVDFRKSYYLEKFYNIYDRSNNVIIGEATTSNIRVISAEDFPIEFFTNEKFKFALAFRRLSKYKGKIFLIEDVYQPLETKKTSVDKDMLKNLADERWRHGEIPLYSREFVAPVPISVDLESILSEFPSELGSELGLMLTKVIYSHTEKILEVSKGVFKSNGELQYIAE